MRSPSPPTNSTDIEDLATWAALEAPLHPRTPPPIDLDDGGGFLSDDDSPREPGDDPSESPPEDIETTSPRIPPANESWIVHGNWCGPGWTGGQKVTATDYNDYGGNWDHPALDRLDAACRDHDLACSDGGCNADDDAWLRDEAAKTIVDPNVPTATAVFIAGGMTASNLAGRDDSPLQVNPIVTEPPNWGIGGPIVPLLTPKDDFSLPENIEKLAGHVITQGVNALDKHVPGGAGRVKSVSKFIPYIGTIIDVEDYISTVDEHGFWSTEAFASGADAFINLFPPLAIANDVFSVVSGKDGVIQAAEEWIFEDLLGWD